MSGLVQINIAAQVEQAGPSDETVTKEGCGGGGM